MDELIPNLMVEDVEATSRWYERTFNADIVDTVKGDEQDDLAWAQITLGDISLMFQRRNSLEEQQPSLAGREIGGSLGLYIIVEDATDLYERIADFDAEVVTELHETWYGRTEFAVNDFNGYLLWFAEQGEEEER